MYALKLAEKRHSVREFKHKKLSELDKDYIVDLLKKKPNAVPSTKIEFHFIDDGYEIASKLSDLAGYFGMMINAPHYLVVLCDDDDLFHKAVGYEGEWLILKALKKDIGSCWLEVKNSNAIKSVLGLDTTKEVAALIAVGYAKKETQQSNLYVPTGSGSLSSLTELGYPNINAFNSKGVVSERKSITEFVYLNEWGNTPDIKDLEMLGIHEALFYMRLAPSYENRQPWHFLIKGKEIDLLVEKNNHISETIQGIDAGIAMLYFEVGIHDAGIKGKWDFSNFEPDYVVPDNFKIVGRYQY